jgi:hypothetical protein
VALRAPAALCQPIDGQPYDQVPTERPYNAHIDGR